MGERDLRRARRLFRHAPRAALVVFVCAAALLPAGCFYVSGEQGSPAWEREPRDVLDDWRRVDMQSLMAFSDEWFTVDEKQRGTVRGYASGGVALGNQGGYFELSVISRRYNVPVKQSVRVYFDQFTPVYEGGERVGTVQQSITGQIGTDITAGGKVLEVPFHVNGGRLTAERVTVTDEREPLVP